MRDSGKISAAIAVLEDFETRRVPLKVALADWARGARYAGAKDRAWISGLCLDALRRRRSLASAMGDDSARATALGALRWMWDVPVASLAEWAAEAPHGPGALTEQELTLLGSPTPPGEDVPLAVAGDFPDWLAPHVERVFGDRALAEMSALATRADVDLRVNTLKTEPEKALAALSIVGAEPAGLLRTAARIPAPSSSERAAALEIIPAFHKSWFEVQDLGSQIASAAAGAIKGAQVLDFCAGGGGKTLALAALMENKGQLYAWDSEPRRLKDLYERSRRAGVRNLQIRNLAGGDALDDLSAKMDVVFVDAPCTGSGTWRRHPDAKWRLTPEQLSARMAEQDGILAEAAAFVKPGGRLVYVTCSLFMEENEDRLAVLLASRPEFSQSSAFDAVVASGLLTEAGRDRLAECSEDGGALRLTSARIRADGFFIATLTRTL